MDRQADAQFPTGGGKSLRVSGYRRVDGSWRMNGTKAEGAVFREQAPGKAARQSRMMTVCEMMKADRESVDCQEEDIQIYYTERMEVDGSEKEREERSIRSKN